MLDRHGLVRVNNFPHNDDPRIVHIEPRGFDLHPDAFISQHALIVYALLDRLMHGGLIGVYSGGDPNASYGVRYLIRDVSPQCADSWSSDPAGAEGCGGGSSRRLRAHRSQGPSGPSGRRPCSPAPPGRQISAATIAAFPHDVAGLHRLSNARGRTPSRARAAASALRAAGAAWPTQPPTWWIASSPRPPYGSGCSRCRSVFATASPTMLRSRAPCSVSSCGRSSPPSAGGRAGSGALPAASPTVALA